MSDVVEKQPLTEDYLKKMDAYWRAANYLGAAQLYLLDNPLLREPLTRDQVKKKIVGHWGTVPGQNFVYVHLNRVIKKYDQDMILISGPGHGGNFFVANTYLEGTYSEVYPKRPNLIARTSLLPILIWKVPTARYIQISEKIWMD